MANPTTTARTTPAGLALTDGFSTKIAFAADPDVEFWEKTVKPPGFDGGDAIDQTTMHNTLYRVFLSRSLITLTEITLTAAYDPKVLDSIAALMNVITDITIHFPNSDTWDIYGWLRMFDPQSHEEGTQPECQITIQPSNWDPDANVEAGPNYISAAGTD